MKRTFWAFAGYTAGLGTSLYVQKRVKKTVERVTPEQVRADVADRSRRAAGKAREAMVDIRDAANEGLTAMRAEKADLLAEFAGDEALHTGPARRMGRPGRATQSFRPRHGARSDSIRSSGRGPPIGCRPHEYAAHSDEGE